jgi:hypothetical protein
LESTKNEVKKLERDIVTARSNKEKLLKEAHKK